MHSQKLFHLFIAKSVYPHELHRYRTITISASNKLANVCI